MSLEPSLRQSSERVIPPSALALLQRLEAICDPRLGLPISSHRPPPVGPILVFAKKAFRSLFQPFINELLRKQFLFNEDLLKVILIAYHDIHSVEGATLAMRVGLQERLRRLEERLAALESRIGEPTLGKGEVGPTTTAGDKNGSTRAG